MAVTITETIKDSTGDAKIVFDWTSASNGTASGTTSYALYNGRVRGLTTVPGADTAAPTDNYDITITDSDGDDVLLGAGANRHTSTTQHVSEGSLGNVVESALTLNVSAAGDSKAGKVILWIAGT